MADSGSSSEFFAHESAVIDPGAVLGAGTKVWHFTHVHGGARIGRDCVIGQGCYVADVTMGNQVKVQNNVSIYTGVTIEDGVFLGPSCVFTNVMNPRAEIERKHEYRPTLVQRGASIGANATIVCGVTIGRYAFVGAGAVVRRDVPDHAVVAGVPAQVIGWMCSCGVSFDPGAGLAVCGDCGASLKSANKKGP